MIFKMKLPKSLKKKNPNMKKFKATCKPAPGLQSFVAPHPQISMLKNSSNSKNNS